MTAKISPALPAVPAPRLREHYMKTVLPEMTKRFGYKNTFEAPRLIKIVVNMGVGAASQDVKLVEQAAQELALITGQRPVITRSKKAISNFKLKEDQPIGAKVTLRRRMMYEFMDRLISIAMPRIRDFRGVDPRGFDQGGNYAFGINEQLIFPEIEYDKVTRVQGMDIIFCTTARNRQEAYELLKGMGIPFKQSNA